MTESAKLDVLMELEHVSGRARGMEREWRDVAATRRELIREADRLGVPRKEIAAAAGVARQVMERALKVGS